MSSTSPRKPKYDLTNQKFGKITVLGRDFEKIRPNKKQIYWICQCDCGRIFSRTTHNLLHSTSKEQSCPHCASGYNDLTGQVFDALTVIEDSGLRQQKKILWKCQCQCGNIVNRLGSRLQDKNSFHSCGCMQNIKQINDISNQQFGKLIAIKPNFTYKKENNIKMSGTAYWDCVCECGSLTTVAASNLINGFTTSCGNCVISKGEEQIKNILIKNNIMFETQKTFNSCRSTKTNAKLKFDFYVNNDFLLEYDGRQHFEVAGGSYFTEEMVQEIQERDKMKNNWCKQNNITLKRIPYTVKEITLDDILGDKYIFEETYEEYKE